MRAWRLLGLVFFVLVPASAGTEDITIAYEAYPPYEFHEGGELVGMDVELIGEVCRRLELRPVYRELPWARALAEVKAGKVDAIVSLVKTPEREQFLHFPSEHISYEQFVFIARLDSTLNITEQSELKGRRVGVCRNYSYDPAFDSDLSFQREESLNDAEQLRKLAGRRMDLAIMNQQVFHYTARKLGMADLFRIMPYEIGTKHFMYIAFSKATGSRGANLAEQFDRTLKDLRKRGLVQVIQDKYD